jgi:predicted nicotinamide N-methyase
MKDNNNITWREYNVHSANSSGDDTEDDGQPPIDIFASSHDNGNHYDAYETIQYDIIGNNNNTSITIQQEREYDKSTGMSIWKGAEVMSTYLQQHSNLIKGKRVLELGAGCGLVGLVCALALDAKSVLITDGDYQVLNNLRYNVQRNGLTLLEAKDNDDDNNVTNEETTSTASTQLTTMMVSCPQLIWGKNHAINFKKRYGMQDIIIATDCVYITQSVYPLFETVNELLQPDGIFLFVNTCASSCSIEDVFKITSLEEFGFVCSTKTNELWSHEENGEEEKNPVYVFRRD